MRLSSTALQTRTAPLRFHCEAGCSRVSYASLFSKVLLYATYPDLSRKGPHAAWPHTPLGVQLWTATTSRQRQRDNTHQQHVQDRTFLTRDCTIMTQCMCTHADIILTPFPCTCIPAGAAYPLPDGYSGAVAKLDSQDTDSCARTWRVTGTFSEVTWWGHDTVPGKADQGRKCLEWLETAAKVCTN